MAKETKMLMENGSEVKLTLTFRKLKKLSESNGKAFYDYNNIVINGAKTEEDLIKIIYTAYMCGDNEPMEFDDFIDEIPQDHVYIQQIFNEVFGTGKK